MTAEAGEAELGDGTAPRPSDMELPPLPPASNRNKPQEEDETEEGKRLRRDDSSTKGNELPLVEVASRGSGDGDSNLQTKLHDGTLKSLVDVPQREASHPASHFTSSVLKSAIASSSDGSGAFVLRNGTRYEFMSHDTITVDICFVTIQQLVRYQGNQVTGGKTVMFPLCEISSIELS